MRASSPQYDESRIPSDATRLRVVTYNIRHALGMDERIDLPRIAEVLRGLDADVVCLQEVERRSPRTRWVDQARWLARALEMSCAYGPNLRFGPLFQFGNAILTRAIHYSTWNKRLPSQGEPRGLLHVLLSWGSEDAVRYENHVHVFCTHWGLSDEQRRNQAESCARHIDQEMNVDLSLNLPTAAILCGDFNASLDSPELRRLLSLCPLSAARADEQLLTYPSDKPTVQIDHILTSGAARVTHVRTSETPASDHLPLIADVDLAWPTI